MLFAKILNDVPGIHATVSKSGWPSDDSLVTKADAIWVFCDGGEKHLVMQDGHAAQMQAASDRGAGIMFYHYGTEAPVTALHQEFLDWVGGYFELHYSVNPIFVADFASLPKHPITRGVKPFQLKDEWYYNIRFRDGMKGVTPTSGHDPAGRAACREKMVSGRRQCRMCVRRSVSRRCTMWAYERPNGGRGVGFTGGHFHMNLGDDNFRKVILNALVWIAKGDVPGEWDSVSCDGG